MQDPFGQRLPHAPWVNFEKCVDVLVHRGLRNVPSPRDLDHPLGQYLILANKVWQKGLLGLPTENGVVPAPVRLLLAPTLPSLSRPDTSRLPLIVVAYGRVGGGGGIGRVGCGGSQVRELRQDRSPAKVCALPERVLLRPRVSGGALARAQEGLRQEGVRSNNKCSKTPAR